MTSTRLHSAIRSCARLPGASPRRRARKTSSPASVGKSSSSCAGRQTATTRRALADRIGLSSRQSCGPRAGPRSGDDQPRPRAVLRRRRGRRSGPGQSGGHRLYEAERRGRDRGVVSRPRITDARAEEGDVMPRPRKLGTAPSPAGLRWRRWEPRSRSAWSRRRSIVAGEHGRRRARRGHATARADRRRGRDERLPVSEGIRRRVPALRQPRLAGRARDEQAGLRILACRRPGKVANPVAANGSTRFRTVRRLRSRAKAPSPSTIRGSTTRPVTPSSQSLAFAAPARSLPRIRTHGAPGRRAGAGRHRAERRRLPTYWSDQHRGRDRRAWSSGSSGAAHRPADLRARGAGAVAHRTNAHPGGPRPRRPGGARRPVTALVEKLEESGAALADTGGA